MILSALFISIITLAMIFKHYSELPPEIPLLYNSSEEKWDLLPKMYIFSIPAAYFVLGFINIQVLRQAYYMNKKMTLMICFSMTILYLLGLLAANEIITLSIS